MDFFKKSFLLGVLLVIGIIGISIMLSICIHKCNVKRHVDEYQARVASKVVTTDSVSLQRSLMDTSYIFKYAELNDSNIEQYFDDWHKASKVHQSNNADTSLTILYDKVIKYYCRRTDSLDIIYDMHYFSKEEIEDSSKFYVAPENVRIHKLQTDKIDEEWYWFIDAYCDSISYDVPVIDIGKPVLYLSGADDTVLSNYLPWIYEWRGDAYYEERNFEKEKLLRKYIPVHIGGDIPGYYRFLSTPYISNIYQYYNDLLIVVEVSSFYTESLLLKEGEKDFEVVNRIIV